MIVREIVDAYALVHPDGVERWTIVTRTPDGSLWPYLIPTITFENLAVEYGLDPENIDELLRIALLQFHAPDPWQRPDVETDPAARKGYVRHGLPVRLDNSDSTAQAREAHLERIAYTEQHIAKFVMPKPGVKRTMPTLQQVGGRVESATVEVDAAERLAALKATYRPNYMRMVETRKRLQAELGRDV